MITTYTTTVTVGESLPAGGLAGLALLGAAVGLSGLAVLRRRR